MSTYLLVFSKRVLWVLPSVVAGMGLLLLFTTLNVPTLPASVREVQAPNFGAVRFLGEETYKTTALAVGDLDQDGRLDVVAALYRQGLALCYNGNNGECTVFADQLFSIATSVAVGDVNADGAVDIVVGYADQPSAVYFNDRLGNFSESASLTFGNTGTYSLKLGDVDTDGDFDVVVGNTTTNTVYQNNGAGQFSTNLDFGPANPNARTLALGDIDNDYDIDVVVGFVNRRSQVFINNGTGNFSGGNNFGALSDHPQSVAVGDLDRDGDLDIVAVYSDTSGSQNTVYFNTAGTFTPTLVFGPVSSRSTSVEVADVDNNGQLDLVVGEYGGQNLVYLGPTFAATQRFGTGSDDTTSVQVADLDNDGDLDLVTGNTGANGAQNAAYFNNGAGTYALSWLGPTSPAHFITVGDFNGDTFLDFVATPLLAEAHIYLNDQRGDFKEIALGGVYTLTAVGDLDSDGDLDLLLGTDHQVDWLVNDGSGFVDGRPQVRTILSPAGVNFLKVMAVGDMDSDGDLDVALERYTVLEILDPPSFVILTNDGQGNFVSSDTSLGYNYVTRALAFGDFDQDGDLDLAFGNYLKQDFVLWNPGNGQFTMDSTNFGTGTDATLGLAAGDMDQDGDLDLVTGNYGQPNVVYFNNGAGDFSASVFFGTGGEDTTSIAVGDLDDDGDLDIVTGNAQQQSTVFLNIGYRQFVTQRDFDGASTDTWSVALGDMDRDGDLDIVQGTSTQGARIFWNGGQGPDPLVNNPPRIAVTRPITTGDANFYSTPNVLGNTLLPITYTVFDTEGDAVRTIQLDYSPDGGGRWLPAVAASGTLTRDLFTLGMAPYFDGVDNYAVITDVAGLTSGNVPHTLEGWLYVPSVPLTRSWPLVLSAPGVRAHHWLLDPDGKMQIGVWGFSGEQVFITPTVGQWSHIAASFNGISLSVYLNGQLMGVKPATFNISTTARLALGEANAGENYFQGYIDEVRLWKSARTGAEISANMTRTLTNTNQNNLLGYWRFNEQLTALASNAAASASNDFVLVNGVVRHPVHFPYVYYWDTFRSGLFGQSDNVAVRVKAYPATEPAIRTVPGPYQRAFTSASTFPFRVRGTQVQVLSDTLPIPNAVVYRLSAGQTTGGTPLTDGSGVPFRTDEHGYLQGRGELQVGDQLFAGVPSLASSDGYTLYYTSGLPNVEGVEAFTVTTAGVQTLVVSASRPLYLFDVNFSLEWDASHDPAYLEQLEFNLQRASEYLYDFTDGQMALGRINVFQNADDWAYSHVIIRSSNRLRPFAAQGGLITATVTDTQHSDIVYGPGQISMGSTWNRYGTPGQSLGDDWPVILAHELSHYLFYQDDTYLGLDANGYLQAVGTCTGSAMADVYLPDNTELIFDETQWQANCATTLPEQTLQRNEWETLQLWYPAVISPTTVNPGPSLMPFGFTTIRINDPYTPTAALEDPTFYLDYANDQVSSTEARAYLIRDNDYVYDLGSPVGGQNRVIARGAQPGDRLCVFDRPYAQYGCELVKVSDNRLQLEADATWAPVIQISPVNSVTMDIRVEAVGVLTDQLLARLYPELGVAESLVALTETNGVYSGTFALTEPALAGNIQVWVNEPKTETDPRRETMVAFSIGGNPANLRGGGANLRGGGANLRGGGANLRGGGANLRGGGAPVISPDGQMIFFSADQIVFEEGQFYTVQGMAGLPAIPPGRMVLGQGYSLIATAGTPVLTGSVSIQYLTNDVLNAGAAEDQLTIYFYDGSDWHSLDTAVDTYFNLATAPSQGVGVYALMSSVRIPLRSVGWNLFAYPVQTSQAVTTALLSISGYYTTVYGYYPDDPAGDVWKLYDVTVPDWVNDLTQLEYGYGYWINVSAAITLHLSNPTSQSPQLGAPEPPATFYGVVHRQGGFVPVAGALITVWAEGVMCGQGRTERYADDIVYRVDVSSASQSAGCGRPGQRLTFRVGSQPMATNAVWDNQHVRALDLSANHLLYLPVINR